MNTKDNPEKCGATLCCKATAQLQMQVQEEKSVADKSLAELLESKDKDENQDTKE